jgi:hypothetical protein
MYVLLIVVCPFVLFLLAIVLSVLRHTDSNCPIGIFKLFLLLAEESTHIYTELTSETPDMGQALETLIFEMGN